MLTIEEIVTAYKPKPRGQVAMHIQCTTTGERGTIKYFAKRISAARGTKLSTEYAKVHRAMAIGQSYRGLQFSRIQN